MAFKLGMDNFVPSVPFLILNGTIKFLSNYAHCQAGETRFLKSFMVYQSCQTPYLPHGLMWTFSLNDLHSPYPAISTRPQLWDMMTPMRLLPDKIVPLGNIFIPQDSHCSLARILPQMASILWGCQPVFVCGSLDSTHPTLCPPKAESLRIDRLVSWVLWKGTAFTVSAGRSFRVATQSWIIKPNKIKQNTEQLLEAKKSVHGSFCYGCARSISAWKKS